MKSIENSKKGALEVIRFYLGFPLKRAGGEARANLVPPLLGVPYGLGETERVLKVGV